MSRIDVTEKIIAAKVSKGLKWSEVAAKVGLGKATSRSTFSARTTRMAIACASS